MNGLVTYNNILCLYYHFGVTAPRLEDIPIGYHATQLLGKVWILLKPVKQ